MGRRIKAAAAVDLILKVVDYDSEIVQDDN
jgi:hypothetical protein